MRRSGLLLSRRRGIADLKQTPKHKALARQVLEYLRANPEEHDQLVVERDAEWNMVVSMVRPDLLGEVGLVGCVAGWIVFFGMTKAERAGAKWRHIGNLAADLIGANRAEFKDYVYTEQDKDKALMNLEQWA